MKQYIVLILLLFCACNIFAQKEVRKNIRKGNSAYEDKRYTAAEESYEKALELNNADKNAVFNLGNTYYRQQRWDEALKAYDDYIKLEESDLKKSEAWSNIGNTFLKKKSTEKPEQAPMPNSQAQQGKEQQKDNLQQAIDAYKNALRLNPNDDETRKNLAIAQKLVNENEEGGGGGNDQQNQDKDNQNNQDKNKDKQDKQDEDKQDQNQDKNKDQNKDKNQDKQDQQQENKISRENIEQILEAIEQDEKETQERVNRIKADEKKEKNKQNRELDKDW